MCTLTASADVSKPIINKCELLIEMELSVYSTLSEPLSNFVQWPNGKLKVSDAINACNKLARRGHIQHAHN